TRYIQAAQQTLSAAWLAIEKYPSGHASLLMALEEQLASVQIIVIRGAASEVAQWQAELAKIYAPRRIVLGIPADAGNLPAAIADKQAMPETVGYICHGTVCSEPLKSLAALIVISRE
ncbi:MAG: thioredoxin domain-containing protein, partial [Candidatus Obscuribacterales bacterium]|nr:thioredoxin domain-containing protein [Steroidobacteraceae bacterium]